MFELDDQKNDIIYYTLMILFSVATICVLIYMFFKIYFIANFALALLTIGFIVITVFSLRKLYIIYNYKLLKAEQPTPEYIEKEQRDEAIAISEVEEKKLKRIVAKEIAKSIICCVLAVFTAVVLVLF